MADAQKDEKDEKDEAPPPGGVPKDPRKASIVVKATPLDRDGKRRAGEGERGKRTGVGLEVNLEVRG